MLAGDSRGSEVLRRERNVVDLALRDLFEILAADQSTRADPLEAELQAYRRAADAVIAGGAHAECTRAVSPEGQSGSPSCRQSDDDDPRRPLRDRAASCHGGER